MSDQPVQPALLTCSSLEIRIGDILVTRGLSLSIGAGQCWCVLGKNGVGKTTLLHTLAGLRAPTGGSIELQGSPLNGLPRRQVARQVGVLFQDHQDSFPATVLETVLQGRHPHLHAWQWESDTDRQIARRALARVGLSRFASRNIQTLSGGERRRVAIATLLAQETQLLLLDEPTNHLDLHHRLEALETLVEFGRQSGRATVMVLHDVNLASRFADHLLLLLGDGETRFGEKKHLLETATLERVYGHPLYSVDTPMGRAWLPR